MPYDWLISGVFSTSGGRRTSRLQIRREPTQVPCHLGNSNPVWIKTRLDGLFRHHPDTFQKGHPSATFEVQCSGTFLLFHVVCDRQSIPFCASRWQSDGLELFEFRRIQTNKSVSCILLWQQSAKQFPKKSQAPQKMDHAVFHLFTQPSWEKKIHFEDIHHLHHFKHQILQSNDEILRPCILARVGHYLGKTRLMFQVSLGFSERWNLFILKHKNTWENISTYICESHTWKDEHIKNYGKCLIRWKADQKAQIISWEPFFIPCVLLAFFASPPRTCASNRPVPHTWLLSHVPWQGRRAVSAIIWFLQEVVRIMTAVASHWC